MYETPTYHKGNIKTYNAVQGETIETKIERIVSNKEPIKDGAPLLYTERKEGVRASTNIRTDRFEVAVDAADKIAKSYKARREEKAGDNKEKKVGEPESIQGKPDAADTTKK